YCLAVACSTANVENPAHAPDREPDPPAEEPRAGEPVHPEIDPGSSCGRALACCRAYCAAIPEVPEASACEGIYEALDAAPDPDARCRMMADGWGQALQHLRG